MAEIILRPDAFRRIVNMDTSRVDQVIFANGAPAIGSMERKRHLVNKFGYTGLEPRWLRMPKAHIPQQ